MGNINRATATIVAMCVGFSVGLTAAPSVAHDDDHHRFSGDRLQIRFDATNYSKSRFKFKTKRQLGINTIPSDPRLSTTTLSVRGSGIGDADTGALVLNPTKWKASGASGYTYKDNPKSTPSKGIRKIQIKTSSKGGSLKIIAKGGAWDFHPAGAQTTVQIHLSIDQDVYCAEFSDFDENTGVRINAVDGNVPTDCFAICGNSIQEIPEECDDGNKSHYDGCANDCRGCDAEDIEYNSTFEGIQSLIFDNPLYQCSDALCHGSALAGGLDLRDGASYASLINAASQIDPGQVRVFPGAASLSLLYNKIAEKTLGTPDAPGAAMPNNAQTVAPELLQAMKLWIGGGASETAIVGGTADLFGACLPVPTPLDVPQPDPPPVGTGVQLPMPGWYLPAQSEDEICVATYYDIDDPILVPPALRVPCPGEFPATNPSEECFAFNSTFAVQDAHSHHLAVHIYKGIYPVSDPGWGDWSCYGGADDGVPCDPTQPGVCPDGVCGGAAITAPGCFSANPTFGPADYGFGQGPASPRFAGGNNATSFGADPEGVYTLLPLSGLVVYNSHAFNLTIQDTLMEAWVNVGFTANQQWLAQEVTDLRNIFAMNVPPFETREYCITYTFEEGAYVYQFSSHTHRHGKRFRYYAAPQTPCAAVEGCSPGDPGDLYYETFDYADPLILKYDPPLVYSGSVADRTVKYCALYDNGAGDPAEVKTQSGSPCSPLGCGFGGPCSDSAVKCTDGGLNPGQLCGGNDANCPGAECDACDVIGGITTEDEMFIGLARYYLP
jgi:cysteine-rich repeat protein